MSQEDPIRLAVVDDSAFVRMAIRRMMADDPRIEIVGTASSGEELLARLEEWAPDVITLDLSMPGIGGLLTLDRIMVTRPTPVIILSTHAGHGAPQTIEALHRGAADFIDKQRYSLLDFPALRRVLLEKLIAVTGGRGTRPTGPPILPHEDPPAAPEPTPDSPYRVVLVGASTGGPPAIERVLEDLGPRWPLPVLVVQHMPKGFTRAFADRLNGHLPLEVREAEGGEDLSRGHVLIARAGTHLRVGRRDDRLVTELSQQPDHLPHIPSVDELFLSAALTVGHGVIAVLLTGMGRDGSEGMERVARAGGYTIAQNQETSIVFGMPGAAIALGAAREVLPLEQVGSRLRQLLVEPAAVAGP